MQHMPKLLELSAIFALLLGLIALSSSLVSTIFAYQVRDAGVLLAFSAASLSLGVVLLGLYFLVAKERALTRDDTLEKYRGIAPYLMIAFAIGAVFLAWGWARGLYTARNVIVPLIVYIIFTVWAWGNLPSRFHKR